MYNQVKSKAGLLVLVLLSSCSSARPVGGYLPGFTEESRAEIAAEAAKNKPRSGFIPLLDLKGGSFDNLSTDIRECQEYGAEVSGAGSGALAGAAIGALLGAVIAHASGGALNTGTGAGIGAISGGASGAIGGEQNEEKVVSRCMAGRGYKVLSGM